jgi:Ser/Thr protein kinase RdoA (MazF antagonist)
MPAYTQLDVAQAQVIFDTFRPPADSAAPRRFVVDGVKELLGGLSNSNYRISVRDTRTGSTRLYLLKVCEEKSAEEVGHQVRALALIKRLSSNASIAQSDAFPRPCPIAYPYRVGLCADREEEEEQAAEAAAAAAGDSDEAASDYLFHVPSISPRTLVLYEFLSGAVMRRPTPAVMGEVARAQAQLHSIPTGLPGRDFSFLPMTPFGMFAVRAQYHAQVESAAGKWNSHPFIEFLRPRLAVLDCCAIVSPQLPAAVIHSDLFWENMMFTRSGLDDTEGLQEPKLVGLIDFEEMGAGPRVLDVAMTLVGCCYDTASNELDQTLARAFLRSYNSFAPLQQLERQHFVSFLTWALLAIAYWRWQNFNVVHEEPNTRKEAYRAMQLRVEQLEQPQLRNAIQQMLNED